MTMTMTNLRYNFVRLRDFVILGQFLVGQYGVLILIGPAEGPASFAPCLSTQLPHYVGGFGHRSTVVGAGYKERKNYRPGGLNQSWSFVEFLTLP